MNPSRSSGPTLRLRGHRATRASTTSSSLGHNPGRGHHEEWPKGSGKSMSRAHERPQEMKLGNETWPKGQAGVPEFLCVNHPEPFSIPTQDGRAEHLGGQWKRRNSSPCGCRHTIQVLESDLRTGLLKNFISWAVVAIPAFNPSPQ